MCIKFFIVYYVFKSSGELINSHGQQLCVYVVAIVFNLKKAIYRAIAVIVILFLPYLMDIMELIAPIMQALILHVALLKTVNMLLVKLRI